MAENQRIKVTLHSCLTPYFPTPNTNLKFSSAWPRRYKFDTPIVASLIELRPINPPSPDKPPMVSMQVQLYGVKEGGCVFKWGVREWALWVMMSPERWVCLQLQVGSEGGSIMSDDVIWEVGVSSSGEWGSEHYEWWCHPRNIQGGSWLIPTQQSLGFVWWIQGG